MRASFTSINTETRRSPSSYANTRLLRHLERTCQLGLRHADFLAQFSNVLAAR